MYTYTQCPECNAEGPHVVFEEGDSAYVAECGNGECAREFAVNADEIEGTDG